MFKISFREVETLLIQVEGLMNNRPLTYQTDELKDEPLTPNHMIFGFALPNIASDITKEVDDDKEYSATVNKRLKYVATVKAHLWRRWTREYLQGLKEYQRQSSTISRVPEKGEIVLVVDSSIQKRYWQMGNVIDYIKSKDEMIRAVKVHVLGQGNLIEIIARHCIIRVKGTGCGQETQIERKRNQEKTKRLATFAGEEIRADYK